MIGLIVAIILFNFIAFKTNKRLTPNQIVHIWAFTIAFQQSFDIIVEFKYHGYWYFDKRIDWVGLLPHTILVPPVNMMFLNWYPFKEKFIKQFSYIFIWVISILVYEAITLLPQPWGFFHYGWWTIWHTAVIDPILLLILLRYYKWISNL
nr:hypothetical protein [Cytobacillus gottheilii]